MNLTIPDLSELEWQEIYNNFDLSNPDLIFTLEEVIDPDVELFEVDENIREGELPQHVIQELLDTQKDEILLNEVSYIYPY